MKQEPTPLPEFDPQELERWEQDQKRRERARQSDLYR
jgi:hypothetical protein